MNRFVIAEADDTIATLLKLADMLDNADTQYPLAIYDEFLDDETVCSSKEEFAEFINDWSEGAIDIVDVN